MTVRGNRALKRLDRALGVPTVRLLGFLPKRRRPAGIRKLGILRSVAIGDTLLLAGILADARSALSDAEIVLVTGDDNAEAGLLISRGCARHMRIPVKQPMSALARLRAERFDMLIDTGAWPRLDAVLTALSGARYRVGFETARQQRHFAYDLTVEHSSAVHELENFRTLFRAAGIESSSLPSIEAGTLPASSVQIPAPYFVFHPWSGGYRGYLKEWSYERWVDLADRLRPRASTFVVTGSVAQEGLTRELALRLQQVGITTIPLTGRPLRELSVLLRDSVAVVSVNTGVMHLAALVGARTIALEGPTPPHRWGPIGRRAISVKSALPGCGFLDLGFEYDGRRTDCMSGVAVDDVERAVAELIER